MSQIGDDLLLEQTLKAEEYLHESRTTLDDKAGSIYAAAAVLAVQPSILLIAQNVTLVVLAIQGLGYVFLAGSVYWAYDALDLTEFPIPDPDENERYRNEIPEFVSTPEEMRGMLIAGLLKAATYRIVIAKNSNKQKAAKVAKAMNWLFFALLANTGAFIIHLICRYLAFQYPFHLS